jgi:ABC-type multidrug transport system fused ATPase/permease subunit
MVNKTSNLKFFEINSLIFNILNREEKKNFLIFIILAFLSLILEALGISLFLPIISYLISPQILTESKLFNIFKEMIYFEKEISYFYLLISLFTFIFILKNVILILINYWQLNFGNQIRLRMSNLFFFSYLKQNISFFLDKDKTILSKYTHGETNNIKETIFHLGNFYSEIFIILFLVGFIFIFNNSIVITLLIACFLIAYMFDSITKSRLRRAGQERFDRSNITVKVLMDSFKSIRDLKLYNKEEVFFKNFKKNNKIYGQATVNHGFILNLPRFFFESIALLFFLFLTILNLKFANNSDKIFVDLSVLFLITIRLLPSANKVASAFVGLRYVSHGISEMVNQYNQITNLNNLNDHKIKNKVTKFYKSIKLKSVDFGYDNKKKIFENLNFEIKKGERVALVGDSGSGKSTFLDLMTGFIFPSKGQIIFDSHEYDINKVSRLNLFGYVHQDVVLFNDTIINNITLSNKSEKDYSAEDLDKIYNYCKKAQIYDFVMSLPNKIFSKVGEDGLNISGGQKQRIGIVRALAFDASVLILDEATNSLDQKTEESFFQTLENLNNDLTIISINHKLNNKEFFNHIYELKDKNLEKIKN